MASVSLFNSLRMIGRYTRTYQTATQILLLSVSDSQELPTRYKCVLHPDALAALPAFHLPCFRQTDVYNCQAVLTTCPSGESWRLLGSGTWDSGRCE